MNVGKKAKIIILKHKLLVWSSQASHSRVTLFCVRITNFELHQWLSLLE